MKTIVYSIFMSLVVLASCSHYDELQKNGKESKANSSESHNAGRDCMTCHNKSEFDEAVLEGGWWNIAGTVYQANGTTANEGVVELWTGPNRTGSIVYKLPIDARGNFYTAKVVDFKGGFYPVLIGNDGNVKGAMGSKISIGACNSCHGVSTNKITLN